MSEPGQPEWAREWAREHKEMSRRTKEILADHLISKLNEIAELDQEAMCRLVLDARVPCNDALAGHLTVQVRSREGEPHTVGVLGLLNGLVGTIDEGPKKGWGLITAVVDTVHAIGKHDEPVSDRREIYFRRTKEEREYPVEHRMVVLRETDREGVYEQMQEVWHRLGEMGEDEKVPRKLISATSTGRKFRLTRTVSPEAVEDAPHLHGPKPNETIQCLSPEDFLWRMFEQIEGEPNELECSMFGPRPPEYE